MGTFDPAKDAKNKAKHGISLARGDDFGMDEALIEEDLRPYGEQRWIAYGPLDGALYVLVFTLRDDEPRYISLRRATKQEARLYREEYR